MMKQTDMNKKMVISCIVTIIIIVLASFTSAVGFQTTKSMLIKDTPLFTIRSQRATNRPAKRVVTSEYIGKRKTITISFPTKNSTLLLFLKTIDGISTINDKTFAKFLDETISKFRESRMVKEKDIPKIKQLFQFLKDHPEEAKKYPFDMKKHSYTLGCPPPTFVNTPKECFLVVIYFTILLASFLIWYPIFLIYLFYQILTHEMGCLPLPTGK
ncbi:MAG: hypothetical protein ACOC80_06445 [Petrotogales bacterium]